MYKEDIVKLTVEILKSALAGPSAEKVLSNFDKVSTQIFNTIENLCSDNDHYDP